MTSTFEQLGLAAEILQAVADEGYSEPTPIQSAAIPVVLAGRDVLATAQTGTGKTAAFVLPILQRLKAQANTSFSPARHPVRALVVTPTRELAVQVADSVAGYARHLPLRSTVAYGGVPIEPQAKALLGGVEILVATPGRLLDHLGSRTVNLSQVEVLVLDEADRMLDMGFMPDIRRILDALPAKRQNLMFSATFSDDVRGLAGQILRDPERIAVAPKNATADRVRQLVYPVDRDRKEELLAHLIRKDDLRQVLVFTRTKLAAARLASWLDRRGIEATAIHGDRSQADRSRALEMFKSGTVRVLVATDVAARGLDIEDLPHVVNFELPFDPQDYIHRIGRTARAGLDGDAISLVCIDETDLLRGVQRMLKVAIPWAVEDGFIPDRNAEPRPVRVPGGRTGGGAPRRAPAASTPATASRGGRSRRRRGTGAAAA
ncbi:MAG TPA: DEAD/DEAH box helicase [Candidatus Limnocylindrales bacterium]|nr:DEAD/DEAH box helicase [Candidatus Limnocylindrales bacterium]